ncbi:superoxide dismutase [Micromonospora sp. DT46]|uniref:superoxide dismutase n=1 Tax=unclassified Micromonospora TaxID=2617518 RepID=UPI00124B3F48|nr:MULTISPECIES: superoxide dismutase [unclassified Micromonospora]KAB1141492.1 superoxide dismutase [Micromonospora sp. AMSO12t]WSG02262.1 superoxide dismutase [Micromonospora sp. NBC_01740]
MINLPNGFCPEGIARGTGTKIYVSSMADGCIWCADLRTGKGKLLVPPVSGTQATGLDVERGRIWAACGNMGGAAVYRESTGECLATYDFGGGFIDGVTATSKAVFFTDSEKARIYCVEFGRRGSLPKQSGVRTLPLPGGLGDPTACNTGIVAAWAGKLIVVQARTGRLYCFDPRAGMAAQISTGGVSVSNADGLLLKGRTLYVVRNRNNVIAKFRLNERLTRAMPVDVIRDRDLDEPSAVVSFGSSLYAVNARLSVPATPGTTYCVVRVRD